jgi:hypothetical protein
MSKKEAVHCASSSMKKVGGQVAVASSIVTRSLTAALRPASLMSTVEAVMRSSGSPIHTALPGFGQDVVQAAAAYQSTALRLIGHAIAGDGTADTIHSIRTHCRRLQALLELCDNRDRAAAMAHTVSRMSRLRALQVFRQYLMKVEAPESDIAAVESWIAAREQKLNRTQAYRKIEQAIWKQALPTIASHGFSLKHRLEVLRHEHERVLSRLIEKASEKPRRTRLHALRSHSRRSAIRRNGCRDKGRPNRMCSNG